MEANEMRHLYITAVVELAKDLDSDEEVRHLCLEKGVDFDEVSRILHGDEVHGDDMFSTTLEEDELLDELAEGDDKTKTVVQEVLMGALACLRRHGLDTESDDREEAFKAAIYRYIRDSQK
jgi:hypothetical protein